MSWARWGDPETRDSGDFRGEKKQWEVFFRSTHLEDGLPVG